MKKVIFTFLMLLMLTTSAWATLLVCDPNPQIIEGYYVMTGLPSCVGSGLHISAQADGSLALNVDCVVKGTSWPTTVMGCNIHNDCSVAVSYTLARPINPTATSGVKLASVGGVATMISNVNPSAIGQKYVVTGFPSCIGSGPFAAQADGSFLSSVACIAKGTTWNTTLQVCTVWGDCNTPFPFILTRPAAVSAPVNIGVSP